MTQPSFQAPNGIFALLGPTNTGKTHRAIERMLEYDTGMLGLPLRLLAREVYDKITERIGEQLVALITGEEKRIPRDPRYFICTVEAMPVSRSVDFVGVDEIQLCAHPQRGHVFTERLLHARGRLETWFMGADTMRPLMQELVPEARILRHPRLSQLLSVGRVKLGALPAQSAVVAFSAARVYELGERLKVRRGGAAIVMGALSPRARNAQVALYQSGEVKYMVATDAIGMGLNMNVDHVSFADTTKFDGSFQRPLDVPELAQIAGRAGRHLNAGTFGTLFPTREFSPQVSRAIEHHRFHAIQQIYWRNPEVDTRSLDALLRSLRELPRVSAFRLADQAVDFRVLKRLAETEQIRKLATTEQTVALFWQVCQIPDYRQLVPEFHANLVLEIFEELIERGQLRSDWFRTRVRAVDRSDGDLDTLLARLAQVRTWTYVSNQSDWLERAEGWQEATREVEDRLSDALHARLVERFVERGKLSLALEVATEESKNAGFSNPFASLSGLRRELLGERPAVGRSGGLVERLIDAPFQRLLLDGNGRIRFESQEIGKLTAGQSLLLPEVVVLLPNLALGEQRRVERRLRAWSKDLAVELLGALRQAELREFSAAARGLAYQLVQRLGSVLTQEVRAQLGSLTEVDRRGLRERGVRIGRHVVYVESSVTSFGLLARSALCAAYTRARVPELNGKESVPWPSGSDRAAYAVLGYWALGSRALRVDYAERLSQELYRMAQRRQILPESVAQALGTEPESQEVWLRALGFRLSEAREVTLPKSKRRRKWYRSPASQ
ncbi:MAG: DEAD/DEAH box helicase [Polyangiaceae bacterium]|nr:DEAD/DEAH box helicase [Polyangiaceae bacterium]